MKKIAVLTSGSDAPGMNACIRAVVRSAHYYSLEAVGVFRGYEGLINGDFMDMDDLSVSNIIQKGGTLLKCGKSESFTTKEGRRQAFNNLQLQGIDGLIVLGGNGTFKGAEIFFMEHGVPCIGVPCTIDNDLFGTDFTIGYDTAVNTALAAIDQLRDTADSHERVFFIEVMGRDTGYIAIRSAIAGGAELAITAEMKISFQEIVEQFQNRSENSNGSHIIVVAEDNETGKANTIAESVKKAVPGLDTKVTTLGYVQRGGEPSAADRVLASQLGLGAVEALVKGKSNAMAGVINGHLCYTPFYNVIGRKKPIGEDLTRLVNILNGRRKEDILS